MNKLGLNRVGLARVGGGASAKLLLNMPRFDATGQLQPGEWSNPMTGTTSVTDNEGNAASIQNPALPYEGGRDTTNYIPTQDVTLWTKTGAGALVSDNGDGSYRVTLPSGAGVRENTLSNGGAKAFSLNDQVRLSGYIKYVSGSSTDFRMQDSSGWTSGVNLTGVQNTITPEWQRLSAPVGTLVGDNKSVGLWWRNVGTGTLVIDIKRHKIEDVTGNANQNPSEYNDGVSVNTRDNPLRVDANGVVLGADGAGLPLPTTDRFSRTETNLYAFSGWDAPLTLYEMTGGTASISADERTVLLDNPGGGRAFIIKDVQLTAGRTYCVSVRAEHVSGGVGSKDNIIKNNTLPSSGDYKLQFDVSSAKKQIIFTAAATEITPVRFGIGCSGAEPVASSWRLSEPMVSDVTDLINQNAPSEVVDGTRAFFITNENTASGQNVVEVPGVQVKGPFRAFNYGVIYGDSFTNDPGDLGTNLPDLVGVALDTEGVTSYRLDQIAAIMLADAPKPNTNFVLLEGGVNDLGQAFTDPTDTMKTSMQAMVDHAVANNLQYLIYNVGPWNTHGTWTAERQSWQDDYNAWLEATFPGRVVDMYSALEDTVTPGKLNPAYDVGDGLHPNAAGHLATDTATAPMLSPLPVLLTHIPGANPTKIQHPLPGNLNASQGTVTCVLYMHDASQAEVLEQGILSTNGTPQSVIYQGLADGEFKTTDGTNTHTIATSPWNAGDLIAVGVSYDENGIVGHFANLTQGTAATHTSALAFTGGYSCASGLIELMLSHGHRVGVDSRTEIQSAAMSNLEWERKYT